MLVVKTLSGAEARKKFKEGIDLVANLTKITIGPKGQNVAINKFGPLPTRIINDGVSIAKEIKSTDPFIQAGVESTQEICAKTNDLAGDATSQTALLSQAISAEGEKRLAAGLNGIDIKNEIEEDSANLITALKEMSTPITAISQIEKLATISGNNDPEIGKAIAEIMDKVGLNASLLIDKGNEEAIRTETVKGMYFDKGYRSPAFINQFEKSIAEYEEPNIFIVDQTLRWDDEMEEFFKKCQQNEIGNIVLIANEIDGEAWATLCLTHKEQYKPDARFRINILAIEAPYVGPDRKEFMEDLAIYTGGKIITKLNEINPADYVGSCKKIVSNSKTTTIVGGNGKQEEIDARVLEIKNLIGQLDPTEKTIKEKQEKRRDSLESGVGIIYAGGKTEIEIKDRYLRLEDAVRASKAAIAEGFIAGGGFTLLKLSELATSPILSKALRIVTRQIAENAGENGEYVVERCLADKVGYNAKTGIYENLEEAGVIDATLAIKSAIQNAVSLVGLYLTMGALICEVDEVREVKK